MNVAVTGASGFIGRYVVAELVRNRVEVTAITRDRKNLEDVSPDVNVVEMDMASPGIDSFRELGRPDVLLHLAWDGLPNYRSVHHFESELPTQYAFLKSLIEAGLSSLLVTGTCFEYGNRCGPLAEHLPAQPDNPYGYAKNALRQQLVFLGKQIPFSLTWTRLFYMYGERQPATSLYAQLKSAVMRGDRAFDMSGGEQLRDFLAVPEVARIIVALALSRTDSGVVNVCSGRPVSVRKLVESWIKENGWEIELNLGRYPYPDHEPMAFWGDPSKLHEILRSIS